MEDRFCPLWTKAVLKPGGTVGRLGGCRVCITTIIIIMVVKQNTIAVSVTLQGFRVWLIMVIRITILSQDNDSASIGGDWVR